MVDHWVSCYCVLQYERQILSQLCEIFSKIFCLLNRFVHHSLLHTRCINFVLHYKSFERLQYLCCPSSWLRGSPTRFHLPAPNVWWYQLLSVYSKHMNYTSTYTSAAYPGSSGMGKWAWERDYLDLTNNGHIKIHKTVSFPGHPILALSVFACRTSHHVCNPPPQYPEHCHVVSRISATLVHQH